MSMWPVPITTSSSPSRSTTCTMCCCTCKCLRCLVLVTWHLCSSWVLGTHNVFVFLTILYCNWCGCFISWAISRMAHCHTHPCVLCFCLVSSLACTNHIVTCMWTCLQVACDGCPWTTSAMAILLFEACHHFSLLPSWGGAIATNYFVPKIHATRFILRISWVGTGEMFAPLRNYFCHLYLHLLTLLGKFQVFSIFTKIVTEIVFSHF